MKRKIKASESILSEEALVLTPSALLAFLSEIEELDAQGTLSIEQNDGQLIVSIGESTYVLESADSPVAVDDDVVDTISELDEDGYDEIDAETIENEPVEGGIIKELIKTLAVGGLVRLTKNAIMKS